MRRNDEQAISNVQKRMDGRKKLITYKQACEDYSLGITTLRKMAKDCGAYYKIGSAARIDVEVFEEYLKTFRI